MSPPTLSSLAQELLLHIVAYTTRLRDVSSLVRVNSHFYGHVNKALYKLDAKSDLPRALVWACLHGEASTAELALEAGSDVDAIYGDFVEVLKPNTESGKLLLNQETTPLLGAAAAGHLHLVQQLLDAGANGEWMDERCQTALHLAAQCGHEDIAGLLITRFPELVYVESHGRLAADFAAKHKATFRRILEAMDPMMCALGFETAAINGYDDVFWWLLGRDTHFYLDRWSDHEVALLDKVCRGATEGHVKVASALIRLGLDIDGKGTYQHGENSVLYNVCVLNNPNVLSMARMLLHKGADVNDCGGGRWIYETHLRAACAAGNVELFNLLLSWTEKSKFPRYDKYTIQHFCFGALESGDMDTVNFIFCKFPPTDIITGERSCLLLSSACKSGNLALVRLVLRLGVKRDGFGAFNVKSPLKHAWSNGNIDLLKLLLEEGVAKDRTKYGLDDILADVPWPEVSGEHQLAGFQLLVDHGADPLASCAEKPLHRACMAGAMSCVRLLVDKYGADVNCQNHLGHTPLICAINKGNIEIVDFLLKKGAQTKAESSPKLAISLARTIASDRVRDNMMAYLVEKGADIWSKDSLQISRNGSKITDVSLWMLITNYYGNSHHVSRSEPLPEAGRLTASTKLPQLLLDCGADDFDAALGAACTVIHYPAATLLLQNGADANNRLQDRTPLGQAAAARSAPMVKLLLSYGADPNLQDSYGHAPLYRAVRPGHESSCEGGGAATIKVLLDAGASIYKATGLPSNLYGRTDPSAPETTPEESALTFILQAARCNHPQTMEVILDNTDVQKVLQPKHWINALHSAAQYGCSNTVKLLVDRGLVDIEDRGYEGLTVEEITGSDWSNVISLSMIAYLAEKKSRAIAATDRLVPIVGN